MKPEKEVRERWAEIKEERLAATQEREQAEALIILAAIPKCDAAHGRLGYFWSDCESCVVYRDAAAAVSRLEERVAYWQEWHGTAVDERDAWIDRADAAVGRERELTRALEAADRFFRGDLNHVRAFMPRTLVAEALAGGGRTPTGTDSGGLGLSAEPVAEAAVLLCRALHSMQASGLTRAALPVEVIAAWQTVEEQVAALTTATVSPPEPVSPGAADVAEAGE